MTWLHSLTARLDDRTYNVVMHRYTHLKNGRWPRSLNLESPVSFNEKTIWLKMNRRYRCAHVIADKVRIKEVVGKILGEQYLIPTLAVYERAEDIHIEQLPSSFVLKASHGSGWNILCPDRSRFDIHAAKSRIRRWLNTDYAAIGREYQYAGIPPRIICEEMLSNDGTPPPDYKIFCTNGDPFCIQVDVDRFVNHRRAFYDLSWHLLPFSTLYPRFDIPLPRPGRLAEMLDVARELSRGLTFARIDLYYYARRVYFGEITLHHGGGFEPFIPSRFDEELGKGIDLSGRYGDHIAASQCDAG